MIYSDRCELRIISKNDDFYIRKLYENEQVRKYLGGTVGEEAYKLRFDDMLHSKNRTFHWTVFLRDTKEFIGLVFLDTYHDGINTEIGYQFLPEYWGRGYAKEVITRVLEHGFSTLNLPRIVAETQTSNTASCVLLRKMGMTLEEQLERFGNQKSKFILSNPKVNYVSGE
ncbi:GNAT family N-acetyltransferase [Rossellomorea aquimaris]|uniref:GNAT family N-acetyltransferase n=1 Tax=Rossellomorea aquimaris TaxID=189382 RepID=UPI003CF615AF